MPYVQLTSEERYVIYHLKLYRLSIGEIGRRLGDRTQPSAVNLNVMGRLSQLGFTGIMAHISKQCNAENRHVITEGMIMRHLYGMSNADYVKIGLPMSSQQSLRWSIQMTSECAYNKSIENYEKYFKENNEFKCVNA